MLLTITNNSTFSIADNIVALGVGVFVTASFTI